MSEVILKVKNLTKQFGGLTAVNDVDFDVQKGHIRTIIGPNGAGKTTIFNMVAGSFAPTSGTISFKEHDIAGKKPFLIARYGIARTFQNVKIFSNMTALENVMLARHCKTRTGFVGAALRLPSARREEKEIKDIAYEHLKFVGLEKRASINAASLAFGEQKILEIARGLALEPEIFLLDEPAAGLNTRETTEMAALICRIRDTGVTILLVEHDMSLVMNISDYITVLDHGKKLAEGVPREVQNHPDVIRVYLGSDFKPVESKRK